MNRLKKLIYMTKTISQLFLLLLFGIFIGVLSVEAIIRIAMPSYSKVIKLHRVVESERGKFARYDKDLGWDGLENAEDDFEWADTHHHVRHNRYGYRGSEYNFQRSDKKRILILGDSFVWGFGVENQDIFTSVMEQKTDNSIEVINMGVSGYGNDQEYLLWLQKGQKWAPDNVILMINIDNDFWDNAESNRYGYPKPVFNWNNEEGNLQLSNIPVPRREKGWSDPEEQIDSKRKYPMWLDKLSSYSVVVNLVKTIALRNRYIREYLEKRNITLSRIPGYDWQYPLYLKNARVEDEKKWNVMFKIVEKLNADIVKKGSKLTIVIIPSIVQVYPELWNKFTFYLPIEHAKLDSETPNRRISEWCKNNGIDVIDLLPGLKAVGLMNPYLYYPINRHWTHDGHRVVADILLSQLSYRKQHD